MAATKSLAKNELLKKGNRAYYAKDANEAQQTIYRQLISYVLTINDPFEERVSFICQHLLLQPHTKSLRSLIETKQDPETFLNSASEILSEQEKDFLINIFNNIQVQNIQKQQFHAILKMNGVTLGLEGPTAVKAINSLPKHPKCLEMDIRFEKFEDCKTVPSGVIMKAVKNFAFGNLYEMRLFVQ